jgi:hypothetical protein
VLTQKGRDLQPVLLTLKAWGDRHVYGDDVVPLVISHSCGAPLKAKLVCEVCGGDVTGRDLKSRRHAAPSVGEALQPRSA